MKIDISKLERNKSKFDKEWYILLNKFITKTNNNLHVLDVKQNFYLVSSDKNNPIILRVPFTILLQQNKLCTLKELIAQSNNNYEIYHNSFTQAVQQMNKFAKSKGLTLDEDDVYNQITTGSGKPKDGQTKKYHIKLHDSTDKIQKKLLHAQVYYDNNRYQLNMYIN